MRETAQLKGGKCLSKEYIDAYTPLKWICEKGHTWEADYWIVQQGGWCVQCSEKKRKRWTLEAFREIARSHKGKCLSTIYVDTGSRLKFQCEAGHIWETSSKVILRGHWCQECAGSKKHSLDFFQKIAESKGGRCLSVTYKNNHSPLKFECSEGHIWETSARSVMNCWCPACAGRQALTLEICREVARSRGGKCLSQEYVDVETPMKWQCVKGHEWTAHVNSVKNLNSWCPVCGIETAAEKRKDDIDEYIAIAEKRGGMLLSKKYINSRTYLKWQCREGHVWMTSPRAIKSGQWCAVCAGKKKLTIEEMQRTARLKGGRCLSKKYINVKEKLTWQCSKGHIWKASYNPVRNGSWCPFCAGNRPGIKELKAFAEAHRGKFLSKKYISYKTRYKWGCEKGHTWVTARENMRDRKKWCLVCGI
jgi:hypothetical protein